MRAAPKKSKGELSEKEADAAAGRYISGNKEAMDKWDA
jgi:hypothetical protein